MFDIRHHPVLDSTNDEAKRLAANGCPHGTVIWADEQTAGRGRFDRPWLSPPGNLLFSVVLRPRVPARRAAATGFSHRGGDSGLCRRVAASPARRWG